MNYEHIHLAHFGTLYFLSTTALPWSVIEERLGTCDLRNGDLGEVRPLREELPDQSVGVLVRTALPRRGGVSLRCSAISLPWS